MKKHPYDENHTDALLFLYALPMAEVLLLQDGADFIQHLTVGLEALEEILLVGHANVPPKLSLLRLGCRRVDRPLVKVKLFAGITSGRRCAASRRSLPWT